ncbi:MAG: PDZ domain-containing protein [candidate division KSB1 bacterium]|nr:PDZ domain-containing protein [candidate division KSB1 bacterium]
MKCKTGLIALTLVLILGVSGLINHGALAGEKGKGYLGVVIGDISSTLKTQLKLEYGVVVKEVSDDSPAEKAGIMEDDIITEVNGTAVRKPATLSRLIGKNAPGDKVNVTLYRNGSKKSMKIELGEKEYVSHHKHGDMMKDFYMIHPRSQMGVKIMDFNDDLADYFSVKKDEGVLVLEVFEESAAEKAGIKAGDVIMKLNDEVVSTSKEIREILSEYDEGEQVSVEVMRKQSKKSIDVVLDKGTYLGHDSFIKKMVIPDMEEIEIEIDDDIHEDIEKLEEDMQEKEIRIIKKRRGTGGTI